MMDDYLKFRALHQGSPAGSIEQYERTYQSLLGSLQHDVPRALTRDAVERWVMAELERGVSTRTMSSRVAHVVSLGEHLVRKRLFPENPVRGIERPRYKRRPTKFLFPEELRALMAADGPEHERVALALFLDTMLRVSELANARVGDIERTEGETFLRVVVKGGEEKRVPIYGASLRARRPCWSTHGGRSGRGPGSRSGSRRSPPRLGSRDCASRPTSSGTRRPVSPSLRALTRSRCRSF
jgi:site-specific recombinase XerC